MPRFFVTSSQIKDDTVTLTGDDARHISFALRAAPGERITVCDMSRTEYECELTAFLPDAVVAKILSTHPANTESPIRITLYQALPKGDKLDTVIQKAVECGVCCVVPFESERCVVRMKPEAEARKTERRNKIAHEAAKQCGRGIIPQVMPTVGFDEMVRQATKSHTVLFCFEGDGTLPIGRLLSERAIPAGADVALVIGSEGGFSQKEAQAAADAGFLMTGLGPRILRTETAPLFALACLSYHFELIGK